MSPQIANGSSKQEFDADDFTEVYEHPDMPGRWIVFAKDNPNVSHEVTLKRNDRTKWQIREGRYRGRVGGSGKSLPDDRDDIKPPSAPSAPSDDLSFGEELKGVGQSIIHGGTFGWADDALGKLNPEAAAAWERQRKAYREEHPIWNMIGEITGGVGGAALATSGAGLAGALGVVRGAGALGKTAVAARAAQSAKAIKGGSTAMKALSDQASRGLGSRTLQAAGTGAGYGALYGAGEAPVGQKKKGAAWGAALGGGLGGAIPATAQLGGLVLRKGAETVKSRVPSLTAALERGHTTGAPSSEATLARMGGATPATGGLLQTKATGPIAGMVQGARRIGEAIGRPLGLAQPRGLAHAAEEATNTKIISQLSKSRPVDWKQQIKEMRRNKTELMDEAGNKIDLDTLSDEEMWLRTLDHFEKHLSQDDLMAVLTPELAAEAASTTRMAGHEVGLLRQGAADAVRGLNNRVKQKLETFIGRKNVTGTKGTAQEALDARIAQRKARAGPAYDELAKVEVGADTFFELRNLMNRSIMGQKDLSAPLEDAWRAMVSAENIRRADLGLDDILVKHVSGDDIPQPISLKEALAAGDASILNNIGAWDILQRSVADIGRKVANPLTRGNMSPEWINTFKPVSKNIRSILDKRATAVGTPYKKVLDNYRRDSDAIRWFDEGVDAVRMKGNPKDFKNLVLELERESPDAAKGLKEGFVKSLLDDTQSGRLSNMAPESRFMDAEEYLKILFPGESDAIAKLIKSLSSDALKRRGLASTIAGSPPGTKSSAAAEAAQAVKTATYAGAGQTQALVREVAAAAERATSPATAQGITMSRSLMQPMRRGMPNLYRQQRYNDLRNIGRDRFVRNAAPIAGQAPLRAMFATTPSASRDNEGLLTSPFARPQY